MPTAEIGVFGGSGFYSFLPDVEEVEVDTPYGKPSAPLVVGELGGKRVAFLPRHGRAHELPPHRIPYRANVWALRELGVRRIIGPCASGALRAELALGEPHGVERADYPVLDLGTDPESGDSVRVRIGRFGPFVQLGDGGPGRTASLPEDVTRGDDLVPAADRALYTAKRSGEEAVEPLTGVAIRNANAQPKPPRRAASGAGQLRRLVSTLSDNKATTATQPPPIPV